jgi:hypothetical protein
MILGLLSFHFVSHGKQSSGERACILLKIGLQFLPPGIIITTGNVVNKRR